MSLTSGGEIMARFLFVLTRGMEDPTRATRCFQFAKVAKESGHEVEVFLTDDGVLLGKVGMAENIRSSTGDELKGYIDYLIKEKVPIYV